MKISVTRYNHCRSAIEVAANYEGWSAKVIKRAWRPNQWGQASIELSSVSFKSSQLPELAKLISFLRSVAIELDSADNPLDLKFATPPPPGFTLVEVA